MGDLSAGDHVRKRNLGHLGRVVRRNGVWVTVSWNEGVAPKIRPRICHIGELERVALSSEPTQ